MALVIEDGSGVDGANSYVSVDTATAFFSARALTVPTEALLLQAMDILEGLLFKGTATNATQELSFPRLDITDINGTVYSDIAIPKVLPKAQMWLSYYIEAGFNPAAVATAAIKREQVDVLEVEYFGSGDSASTSDPVNYSIEDLPNVFNLIEHLIEPSELESGSDSFGNGRSNRA